MKITAKFAGRCGTFREGGGGVRPPVPVLPLPRPQDVRRRRAEMAERVDRMVRADALVPRLLAATMYMFALRLGAATKPRDGVLVERACGVPFGSGWVGK